MHLALIAKEPVPGRVKTRLCPPCTPEEAAGLAAAALVDTLEALSVTEAARRTLVLDGHPGPWVPHGWSIRPQRRGTLGDRLHGAFADCLAGGDGPVVLVGMDTPQLTPALVTDAARCLDEADAVLGPAVDGGYWLIGLRHLHPDAFRGVPMSTGRTLASQRAQLGRCGYDVALTAPLRDVDTIEDAWAAAASAPATRFASAVAALEVRPP